MAAAITPTPHTSRLLALAPELRNNIYRLALVTHGVVEVNKATYLTRKALLDVCSQVRAEASGFLCSKNHFLITLDGLTVENSANWLITLGNNTRLLNVLEINAKLADAACDKIVTAIGEPMRQILDESQQRCFLYKMVSNQANSDRVALQRAYDPASNAGLASGIIKDSTDFITKLQLRSLSTYMPESKTREMERLYQKKCFHVLATHTARRKRQQGRRPKSGRVRTQEW